MVAFDYAGPYDHDLVADGASDPAGSALFSKTSQFLPAGDVEDDDGLPRLYISGLEHECM